jgi:SAM-dependent methyltransferase
MSRARRALRRTAREPSRAGNEPSVPREAGHDSWLELFADRLDPIEAACANGDAKAFSLFRDLDDDLWAVLLTQEYGAYPNIRALLPSVPERSDQVLWNGSSGMALAAQSKAFYRKLSDRYAAYSKRAMADSRVLDFGCGWGRLTRYLARDVEPGGLYGCDPVEGILRMCRENGVPATLARSDFVPERLPFDEEFDLAYAFSVFTHLSEPAHEACLRALHSSLRPGALLVLTVRPPAYVAISPPLRQALESLGPDPSARLAGALYLFVPHPVEPTHLQYEGGEMTYGETVVTLPYVRERWSGMFELLEVDLLVGDPYQLMLTLRRRPLSH